MAARQRATDQAKYRAATETCTCGSRLDVDGVLLYCVERCGYLEVLSAKARDPREDTPDPVEEIEEL